MEDNSTKGSLDVDQLLEIIRLNDQEGLSSRAIGKIMECSHSTIARFLSRQTYQSFWESHDEKPMVGGSMVDPIDKRVQHTGSKTIIITSAQNNTHAHKNFLASIKQFMNHRSADFYISTCSYAKKAFQESTKGSGWYDKELRPYIIDHPIQLAPGLVFCGEMNISPTAANPLTGLNGYAKGNSAIFGATKQVLETLPAQKHKDPTFMYTTGSVTQRNYIQRKAGQKAEFHHIYGALIIEVTDDGQWFVRQVNCESATGHFYDLDTYYTPDGYSSGHDIEGLVPGDIHTNHLHPEIARATLGVDMNKVGNGVIDFQPYEGESLVSALRPRYLMAHDILDFHVRNHHNIKDPHFRFKQFIKQDESIQAEIENVARLLSAMETPRTTPIVVSSNHDRALIRYIVDNVRDWASDPANALFFLRTQTAAYEAMADEKFFDPVSWNIKRINPKLKTRFLRQDEEFNVAGIACENHGDTGPNGSRGGLNGFVKMGVRMCVGHSHTAAIKDGVFQSGVTCRKDLDYAKGPSSWSWSHTLIYPNGKRTIITMLLDKDNKAIWRN